jgi:hypothetical protein
MLVGSLVSIIAFFGLLGPWAEAFSCFLALVIAFVLSPIVAIVTRGRYYTARLPHLPAGHGSTLECTCCGYTYETHDMTDCPFHKGTICSLCCSLEAKCHDMCKQGVPPTPGLAHADTLT